MAVATKKVSKILEKSTKEYMEQVDVHTAYMKDIFGGIRLVKSFHLMDIVSKQYQQKNTLVEEKKTINKTNISICSAVGNFIGIMGTVIVCLVDTYFAIQGHITVGAILALSQLAGKVMSPLMSVSGIIVNLKSAEVFTAQYQQILGLEQKQGKNMQLLGQVERVHYSCLFRGCMIAAKVA